MQLPRFSLGHWTAAIALIGLVAAGGVQAQASDPLGRAKEEKTAADERAEDAARAAKWLQSAFRGQTTPEAAEMLIAIARGSRMGPGDGWFHPGQGRFGWKWLADRHEIRTGGTISREKFLGPESLFTRLDRNQDGQLSRDDFDWSDRTFYAQQRYMMDFWFDRLNKAADGRLT